MIEDQIPKVREGLEKVLGRRKAEEYETQDMGTEFWLAWMNDEEVTKLRELAPSVIVLPNGQLLENQHIDIPNTDPFSHNGTILGGARVMQYNAPLDLKFVSWRPPIQLADVRGYVYREPKYPTSAMYIIENGVDTRAAEFQSNQKRWLYAPGVNQIEADDDLDTHGSCVASKAVGAIYGVSKKTSFVVVKSSNSLADTSWALMKIYQELHSRSVSHSQPNGPSVVVLAAVSTQPYSIQQVTVPPWDKLTVQIRRLIKIGAIVVVPSGNNVTRSKSVDTLPALLGAELPLLVVGAVDDQGLLASFSQDAPFVSAYAPGTNVRCLKGAGLQQDSGTSLAAGMVAGLAANVLGIYHPTTFKEPTQFQTFLKYGGTWQRNPSGPLEVIWNGQDGSRYNILSKGPDSPTLSISMA